MGKLSIIHEVHTSTKAIAFTFDDGPDPRYTPQLLDIFREAGGKATFFMIGEQMEKYPDVVNAVHAEEHEIGNHTYSHPKLTQLAEADVYGELSRTELLIEALVGNKPAVFRPPYFDHNKDTAKIVDSFGYSTIGAVNGEARDWDQPGVDHILGATRSQIRSGAVLIFHDGYGDRSQSVEAVRKLVAELSAEGYQFLTVSELLKLV